MKILVATTAFALIASSAVAEQSDRYDDLMLDTSGTSYLVHGSPVRPDSRPSDLWLDTFGMEKHPTPVVSTRNALISEPRFPFGGYGAGNDSR